MSFNQGKFAKPQPRVVVAESTLGKRGDYDGAELKPFEGRAGAMDAFLLPSMANGIATPRKAPILNSGRSK
jgi:hypothetical protein